MKLTWTVKYGTRRSARGETTGLGFEGARIRCLRMKIATSTPVIDEQKHWSGTPETPR